MLESLSVVIPAYNEEARLPATLTKVADYLTTANLSFWEVLVVDDGSTDGTAAAVESFSKQRSGIRLLRNPGNRGKGYSVRHGMMTGRGAWLLFTDADLSAPIEELEKLAAAVTRENADGAIGSRGLDRSLIGVHQPAFRENAGKFFNTVMRLATRLPYKDTQCGFKLFRQDAAERIFRRQQLERFGFDVEILYIARKLNYKIVEVPVRWNHVDGSKVGMAQGIDGFVDVLRVLKNSASGRYD